MTSPVLPTSPSAGRGGSPSAAPSACDLSHFAYADYEDRPPSAGGLFTGITYRYTNKGARCLIPSSEKLFLSGDTPSATADAAHVGVEQDQAPPAPFEVGTGGTLGVTMRQDNAHPGHEGPCTASAYVSLGTSKTEAMRLAGPSSICVSDTTVVVYELDDNG